jgi:hypothetical protein
MIWCANKLHHRNRWKFAASVGKFTTSVGDTGGKFAAGVVDTGGNLPPVSLTPVSLTPVANLPVVSLTPVVHLDLRISPQIFEKFGMTIIVRSLSVSLFIEKEPRKQLRM